MKRWQIKLSEGWAIPGGEWFLKAWSVALRKTYLYCSPVFLGTVWGFSFILLLVNTNLSNPNSFDQSDYVMSFYVAGHLVANGQASSLYPTSNSSFAESQFNKAAHSLLPDLPETSIAVFMYSPLVAWLFAPLSKLTPNISLLVWQIITITSLTLSAVFLSRTSKIKASEIVFLSSLFLPIVGTLWSGQLTLVIGLFPFSVGYLLLRKHRPFLSGLAWSFLSLKPQLLFVPAIVILALLLARRIECFTGFLVGLLVLLITNAFLVPMAVTLSWLHSIQLGESLFSSGLYTVREYLITSLPANILLILPVGLRLVVRWYIYTAAAVAWMLAIWYCKTLIDSRLPEIQKISLVVVVALFLLPMTSPYLLYYDFCILLPAGVIVFGTEWPPSLSITLRRIGFIGWLSISGYMLLFMWVRGDVVQPLLLQLILFGLFFALLKTIGAVKYETSMTNLSRNNHQERYS